PGGMGAERMVDYLKASGTILDPDRNLAVTKAKQYIEEWHAAWPEMREYFDKVSSFVGPVEGTIVQLRSLRKRGRCGFTDGANTFFQGLAADGAKDALWRVSEEC